MFTPHQLELFYFVTKYGGISAAARSIPYGIGQPAISGQIAKMEQLVGARLFQRRPFRLTEKGALLFAHLGPYYEGLAQLWKQLKEVPDQRVVIAIEAMMIGVGMISAMVAGARRQLPGVGLDFTTLPPARLERWLGEGQAHVAIAAVDRGIPGLRKLELGRAVPQLLVRTKAKINSPGHFWRQRRIAEPLIYPTEAGALHRSFERGLKGLRVEWRPTLRVDSLAGMMEMIAAGQGVGVGMGLNRSAAALHPGVKAIPLTGFDQVPLMVLWKPPSKPLVDALVAIVGDAVRKLG